MKILSFVCLILVTVSLVSAETGIKAIIEAARATVGIEAALDGLVTVKMSGTIDPAEPNLPSADVILIARKPCSQRLEVRIDNLIETTLLEGQSGCIIQSNLDSTDKRSQLRMMTVEEIRRMAFNTRQLFNFYRKNLGNGESVNDEGIEQWRGLRCHKLVYSYPDRVSITRYFSVDDKKLVSTTTDKGVESVEIGNQTVNGIKFPKRIEYYLEDKLLHTLVLETIEVNKPLEVGIFTIPTVQKTK
ncbi:MAG: hypothetical protein ACI91V_000375 [Lentimonas sp.]|jgi:hypothetical protein